MTRKENIIKGLEARLESIDFASEYLEKSTEKNYSRFYNEISYFVHYIFNTDELNKIFLELLSFSNFLKDNKEYVETKNNIVLVVKEIAEEMLQHPSYSTFKGICRRAFSNPLLPVEILGLEPILEKLKLFELVDEYELSDTCDDTFNTINEIYKLWYQSQPAELEEIYDKLTTLYNLVNEIKYIEGFEHDYIGVKSALNIVGIYSSVNPKQSLSGGTYQHLMDSLIQKGQPVHSDNTIEDLSSDCYKTYHYLNEKLTTLLSIEYTIERFSNYMSLYYNEQLSGNTIEKNLQRKFEEFVFHEGYYPISEAQVGNGRIDSLIMNETNSFLCELKQVDLGEKDEEQGDFDKKVKFAQIQSSMYQERLKSLNSLANAVFVIVFTNRKVLFKDDKDRVERNGIEFIFKCISIYETVPSETKEYFYLEIEELIV